MATVTDELMGVSGMDTFDPAEGAVRRFRAGRVRVRPVAVGRWEAPREALHPASYVGRVGALAVALGIGAAVVALPGVAFADTAGSGGRCRLGCVVRFGNGRRQGVGYGYGRGPRAFAVVRTDQRGFGLGRGRHLGGGFRT